MKLCAIYKVNKGNITLTENRDKNYNVTQFVTHFYNYCLERSGDSKVLNDWTGWLIEKTMTGVDMAIEFFNSNFYQEKNKDAAAFITDIYNLVLHRQPSAEEINAGVERVANVSREEAINRAFISKEFSEKCKSYHVELMNYMNIPAMWYAKDILDQVGWEVYFVEGYVPLARGGMGPHGCVEVVQNGTTYICDPNFAYESVRNGYFFTYGTSGTWRYSSYHRVN